LPLLSSIACNAAAMLKSVLLDIQINLNIQQVFTKQLFFGIACNAEVRTAGYSNQFEYPAGLHKSPAAVDCAAVRCTAGYKYPAG
jgi:hypothetical protein